MVLHWECRFASCHATLHTSYMRRLTWIRTPAVPRSSLPLQILIYFNCWLALGWVLFNLGFCVWKGAPSSNGPFPFAFRIRMPAGHKFPYEDAKGWLVFEVVFTIVYGLIESCRLTLGEFSRLVCGIAYPPLLRMSDPRVRRETRPSLRRRSAGLSASLSSQRLATSTSSGFKYLCTLSYGFRCVLP